MTHEFLNVDANGNQLLLVNDKLRGRVVHGANGSWSYEALNVMSFGRKLFGFTASADEARAALLKLAA